LRKHGRRVRLQDQPLKVLAELCQRPNQLVSRDDLRERLWPADTFVDFEHGLNTAVKRLRDALGDVADRPAYIETLPRRGYRLIVGVEPVPLREAATSTPNGDGSIPPEDAAAVPAEPMRSLPVEARPHAARPRRFAVLGPVLTLGACAALAAGWAGWHGLRQPGPAAVRHLEIQLPDGSVLNEIGVPFALSHDGAKLVYATGSFQDARLFVRSLNDVAATQLVGTVSAESPVFSPDDEWVAFGFDDDHTLRKMPATGGSAQVLARTTGSVLGGLDWSDSGIYFSAGGLAGGGVWRVAATGGTPQPVTSVDRARGESAHAFPQVLPGGNNLMFTILTGEDAGEAQVVVQSLATGDRRVLLKGVSRARYVSSGHLVYSQRGALLAAPFDLARLAITDTPAVLVEGASSAIVTGGGRFAISEEGTLVYAAHIRIDQQSLVWVYRAGREVPLGAPPGSYAFPGISPDGRSVVVLVVNDRGLKEQRDVWLYDLASHSFSRLTFGGKVTNAIWERGGQGVTYAARGHGTFTMVRQATVGDRRAQTLFSRGLGLWPGSWTPDGRSLSYMEAGGNVSVFEPDAAEPHRPFLSTTTTEWGARLSPDGRWMAYISNRSGQWEVYLRRFPEAVDEVQVSRDGGTEVVWASNGRELFYRNRDAVFAVRVESERALRAGTPERLFSGPYTKVLPGVANYDVSRDASRLLMVKPGPEESAPRTLRLMLNWPGRLRAAR
jgi:serine/threonine-protein kinase